MPCAAVSAGAREAARHAPFFVRGARDRRCSRAVPRRPPDRGVGPPGARVGTELVLVIDIGNSGAKLGVVRKTDVAGPVRLQRGAAEAVREGAKSSERAETTQADGGGYGTQRGQH